MAKEEKPLEYQRRIRDTKGVAQRIDLGYLNRPRLLAVARSRLAWLLVAAAVAASVPLVLGVGGSRRAIANGPVSEAHDLFAQRCEVCHDQLFKGAPAEVASNHCTSCHADLKAHSSGVTIKAVSITAFRAEKHPEFSAGTMTDARPLRLNHAIHMPAQAKTIRGVKLPMKCGDCHVTDRNSATGALLPVTFEQNCKQCHARELEFDVYHLLGPDGPPAPHTKDPKTIHEFITGAYRDALAANPAMVRKPLGNDLAPAANWLERVVKDSEDYLFGRKCGYCHTMTAYAVVKPVNRIAGRYGETKPEGEPWFARAEFAHRAHRAVECEACHTAARTTTRRAVFLIPAMKISRACQGKSETGLDRCSECHLYHNRTLEKDRERRPVQELTGSAQ